MVLEEVVSPPPELVTRTREAVCPVTETFPVCSASNSASKLAYPFVDGIVNKFVTDAELKSIFAVLKSIVCPPDKVKALFPSASLIIVVLMSGAFKYPPL